MKYIVITGGVISGLGKGITASSIGLLLKQCNYSVTAIKIDPYLNIDAGTMSPYEHGEVYVLEDGTETDLDLGNYERFLNITLQKSHNITSGRVFQQVIDNERKGEYIGKTVQFIPHVTNMISSMIEKAAQIQVSNTPPDICIVELGGTIGDMESMHFVEALRQMKNNKPDDFCFVHVSLIIGDEEKTKPTQHGIQEIRKLGINPDILALRSQQMISEKTRKKINMHCQVPITNIMVNTNVDHIYQVPDLLHKQGIIQAIEKTLKISSINNNVFYYVPQGEFVNIAIVGKYTENKDTYLSIHRSLEHAAFKLKKQVKIHYISCENINDLEYYDGIIIPGGFGQRGIEGMISTASYCRINNKPVLGICLGMQIMCIEAARNQTLLEGCSSTEFNSSLNPYEQVVISIEELDKTKMGGSMKLGSKCTQLVGDKIREIYNGQNEIYERHRHRYEINPKFISILELNGISIVGKDEEKKCVHIVQDTNKSFYIGCQYHPEYKSSLDVPPPLFMEFLKCIE